MFALGDTISHSTESNPARQVGGEGRRFPSSSSRPHSRACFHLLWESPGGGKRGDRNEGRGPADVGSAGPAPRREGAPRTRVRGARGRPIRAAPRRPSRAHRPRSPPSAPARGTPACSRRVVTCFALHGAVAAPGAVAACSQLRHGAPMTRPGSCSALFLGRAPAGLPPPGPRPKQVSAVRGGRRKERGASERARRAGSRLDPASWRAPSRAGAAWQPLRRTGLGRGGRSGGRSQAPGPELRAAVQTAARSSQRSAGTSATLGGARTWGGPRISPREMRAAGCCLLPPEL